MGSLNWEVTPWFPFLVKASPRVFACMRQCEFSQFETRRLDLATQTLLCPFGNDDESLCLQVMECSGGCFDVDAKA